MGRTSRRSGGLARVQSRQSRLSIQFAKRLARMSRRKTGKLSDLKEQPWWARGTNQADGEARRGRSPRFVLTFLPKSELELPIEMFVLARSKRSR
jgi:hypothetical protein